MTYYCRIDSSGEETNLQLYSLEQASKYWNVLVEDITKDGIENLQRCKERMVFILNCFGLSLSQLLGQNYPSPSKEQIDQPGPLLGKILSNNHIDRETRRRLNSAFRDFLPYYGSVRHFGQNMESQNYRRVDELTIQKLDRFREMTIDIWNTIIQIYQEKEENDLEDLRSVCDLIHFEELPTLSKTAH